jgi:hypothetical protein
MLYIVDYSIDRFVSSPCNLVNDGVNLLFSLLSSNDAYCWGFICSWIVLGQKDVKKNKTFYFQNSFVRSSR